MLLFVDNTYDNGVRLLYSMCVAFFASLKPLAVLAQSQEAQPLLFGLVT